MATQNLGNDLELAQIDYQRKQQLADALRKQSMPPTQGQMVGRRYINPSWTQGLAGLYEGYQADQLGKQATEGLREARQAYDTRNQGELQNFIQAMRGTPAMEKQNVIPNEEGVMTNQPMQIPAQAPDQGKALALALQSKNPILQTVGATLLNREFTPREQKWEKASIHNADGTITHGYADINSKTPESTFRPLGTNEQLKGVVINGQLSNPITGAPMGSAVPKQAEAPNPRTDLLVTDPTGKLIPNQPLIDAKKSISKAGASNINNTVSATAPENTYNKEVSQGLAKESLSLVEAAKAAPEAIRNAQSIRAAIKAGAITGTGADFRQATQKALETAGILGEGKAATTQELMSGLGKLTLAGVKSSGLGAGNGFTDKDREFLQSAISGTIDSTPANLNRIADISERIARANHAKGSKIVSRWAQEPSLKNITQDVSIEAIPVAPTQKTIVRTGVSNGRKVVQYSDGSVSYAD